MQVWCRKKLLVQKTELRKGWIYSFFKDADLNEVTLKVRSRSPKSYQVYILSQWYNTLSLARIRFSNQEISYKDPILVKIWHFKVPLWPWKLGQRYQNLINNSPSPNNVSMWVWSKSEDNAQKPYFGHFKVPVWPWKLGQGHQNLIYYSPSPNNVSLQVWWKSIH